MQKLSWRLAFIGQALAGLVTFKPVDLGVVAFFLVPGGLRNGLFGPTYVARRFLRRYELGDIVREGDVVRLSIADIRLEIPVNGFEQGDVFDILLPYAIFRDPAVEHRVAPYLAMNTDRFYDGPYLTARTMLAPGMTVVDAGASMGLFTVTASKFVGNTGRVIAAEPITEARAFLRRNLKENDCTNVEIVEGALGEETKTVQLDVSLGDHFEGSSKYLDRKGTKREVQQYALDELLASLQVSSVDFLKADIEGSERDLLAGAMRTLAGSHPLLAIRTYHLPDDKVIIPQAVERAGGYAYEVVRGTTLYGWPA